MATWFTSLQDEAKHTNGIRTIIEKGFTYTETSTGSGVWRLTDISRVRKLTTYKWVGIDVNEAQDIIDSIGTDTGCVDAWMTPGQAGSCTIFQTIEEVGTWA
jgi:hypothetical protein